MIPQQLKQMFGLNSQKDVSMANNIWKMLDEMADSSPQKYKQFIQKNIKQGVQQVKQKKDEKQKPFKIKPEKGFLLQFDVILNEKYLSTLTQSQSKQSKISLMLEQKLDINKQDWEVVKKNFKQKMHVLLNVCYSDRVKLPLDRNKKQLHNLTFQRLKQIEIFYYSLQGPVQTGKQGKAIPQMDYCMIVNKNMYESLMRQTQHGKRMLMSLSISYFQQRLQTDRNPLLSLYKPQSFKKLAFYSVQKPTILLNTQRNYFYNGSAQLKQFLLQRQIDPERQKQLQQQQQKLKAKLDKQQQSHQIVFRTSEIQTDSIEDKQCQSEKPNINAHSDLNQKQKRPLIQLLNQTQITNSTTEQFPYELKQTEEGYHIEILTPGVTNLSELDLQISDLKVKLRTHATQRMTQIELNLPINSSLVKAKLRKKINRLVIDAPFLSNRTL